MAEREDPNNVEPDGADETKASVEKVSAKVSEPRPSLFNSQWTYLLIIPALVVVWLVIVNSRENANLGKIDADTDTIAQHPLQESDTDAAAAALGKAWANQPVDRDALPARFSEPGQAVYLSFRAGGKRLYHLWRFPEDVASGGTTWDVLLQALEDGRRGLGEDASRVDRLEIALTHSYRQYDYSKKAERRFLRDEDAHEVPHHMGVRGLLVTNGDKRKIISPTWFLAQNRRVAKQLKLIRTDWRMGHEEFAKSSFSTFEADQLLVRLDTAPVEAELMFRGNRVVDISEVNRASTDALATGMANWLRNNVHADGRLTYRYFPTPEREVSSNNMIRQWMATNAMIRWGLDRDDQAMLDLAEKNIEYNLAKFFHWERDHQTVSLADGEPLPDDVLGVIEWNRKTKLGASGLAAMALWLHPNREKWANEIIGLERMIDYLWHEDGSFTSFYKGSEKEYFNFYPGEAMLFWATKYAETKDPEVLAKYKKSFAYFRSWHFEPKHRNPAFVPWHLQANYAMWSALGDEEAAFKQELVEFSFKTADWLVTNMQQWDKGEYVYPDEKGRFYAPDQRFGVPHASSTGVYLEGLIDAWQLARDLGEKDKQEFYRVAMIRGIRSLMQLQFVDDVDMYYVTERKYVEGGIRRTIFDNRIRCDNVQHPMMALIKIIRMFEEDEYSGAE